MKLAITVLSSILAICSVTVAKPVNPSATTSVESSTSTAVPSAQTTGWINFDQLSDEGMNLIKEYARVNKQHNEAKAMCGSTESIIVSQEKLVKGLASELGDLMDKTHKSKDGSEYEEEVKKANARFAEQHYLLLQFEKKCMDSYWDNSGIRSQLTKIKNELVKFLFGEHISAELVEDYMQLLESDFMFMKLVKEFEALVSGQQLEPEQPKKSEQPKKFEQPEQPSTSGIQSPQHHESSLSSSSQTPTVQSTKASSGKHKAPKHPSGGQRSHKYSRVQKTHKSSHPKGSANRKDGFELLSNPSDSEDSD
ncbi:hypothetical protein QVD99_003975 [Batrachochytrium dendrobatidis]|nr:hypothetical protein QVD99_003975 [Batrachochytrium dendrobatidis]